MSPVRSWLASGSACLTVLAGLLGAQVANDANAGYKTTEGRKAVAQGLADPARDQSVRPAQLTAEMGLKPGMTVADVGTGVGFMLPFLSKRVGATGHVIGEDITDDFLGMARQRAEKQNLTNVTFVKGTETDPNLPEDKVDEVLVLDAYHHFDYPEKMLAAIHKSLKPDGRLVIVEYYKREKAMPNGRAISHIRLDMPDVIKEVEANHFHLIEEKERIRDVQYMLILERN
jgi:ubiquinone/menaquinone biosynthesis C-methylase UbiE